MIYIEDIIFDIKNNKYQKLRGIVCGVLVAVILLYGLMIWGNNTMQAEAIKENEVAIADYTNQLAALEEKIGNIQSEKDNIEYYDFAELGQSVAEIQSRYGGFSEFAGIDELTVSARATAEELDKYIYSGEGRMPWYQNVFCKYKWKFPIRYTSIVPNVPCIWICNSDNESTILAVVTGTYEGESERFGDFKVYYTTQGEALIDRNTVLSDDGTVETEENYETSYEEITEIQQSVSETEQEETTEIQQSDLDSEQEEN